MKLIVFSESPSDDRIARDLIERLVGEEGPEWARDLVDAGHARDVLDWVASSTGHFDLHKLSDYASDARGRRPQGHFNGQAGDADALMARTAFWLVRALAPEGAATLADAVVLLRDMDGHADARKRGLSQARTEALSWASFRIVLGCPDRNREAWVLAGFVAEGEAESGRLADLRQSLGFSPVEEPHRLDAGPGAKKDPKRVLAILTEDDRNREERCWREAPMHVLGERGAGCGLAPFLEDARRDIVAGLEHTLFHGVEISPARTLFHHRECAVP